ncbi:tetratricopeptide repeat protein [Kitasatospora sp. NPDC052868]|uniref:tetratricopeptide repeat protein n=1 Tax=Kitasatospora sp. NPDC052868 TaxID=3364060 RepID=UPI0037CB16B7
MGEQAARELYTRLRELKQAAQTARERAGQPSSDREAERQVRGLNSAAAKKFTAKRVSDWAPEDAERAKVPSPASSGQFIALVTIWSAWAGRPFDERSWRTLLDEAQSNRAAAAKDRPSAPTTPPLPPLPQLTRDFTGRDGELELLLPLLDPDASTADPVLVASVAGMGGIGKTTLALAVAHRALANGWFADALFFDLHGYDENPTTVGQALDSTLRTLGVTAERIPPDDDGRAALFRALLDLRIQQGRGILVVADNASASEQVRHLLPGAGPHRLLITSRHTLADLDAELIDLDVLTPESSVELMATTLRTTKRRPQQITADPEGALRLAKMCGYLPLALELAAAQHVLDPHLTPGELADDLAEALAETGSRLDQLDDGQRAVVRVSLDRSRRLLKIPEAELLDLLAIAPGTDISTDSAAHLTGQKPREVRRRLNALAATGLIRQNTGGGRWIMHDLVRDHAVEHAGREGSRYKAALERLIGYYVRRASSAMFLLTGRPGRDDRTEFRDVEHSLTWLDDERANLVAAVQTARTCGLWLDALQLCSDLADYLQNRRHLDDWESVTVVGIEVAQVRGERRFEVLMWIMLGACRRRQRRLDEALEAYQRALASVGDIDYPKGLSLSESGLGGAYRDLGRLDEARAFYERSLRACREDADRIGVSEVLSNLGLVFRDLGQFEEALASHEESLSLCPEQGLPRAEGIRWNNIGNVLRHLHRYEEAAAMGRRAAERFRELRDPYYEAHALGELADTLAAAGHPEAEVRELREQASEAYASVGETDQAAKALTGEDFRD